MIDLVVFDMAGTVVDEQQIVYKSLYRTLYQSGFDLTYDFVLVHGAGKEKKQAIHDILLRLTGEVDPVIIDSLYYQFKEQMLFQYHHQEILAQPGTEETFERLRDLGIFITLNTGYDRSTAELLLDRLGWLIGYEIDYLVTASDVQRSRPAPDMIFKAMKQFRIPSASQVMKIGDSIVDIEEGLAAGCQHVIGITTGACSREELYSANPTQVIDYLPDLFKLVDVGEPFTP